MPILGLMSTEQFANERFKSIRRSVLEQYPSGTAPLMGILSLVKEESLNDPEYVHYEKRRKRSETLTATSGGNPAGPFFNTDNTTITPDGTTFNTSTPRIVVVASTGDFRVGHIIRIRGVPNSAGTAVYDIKGRVLDIISSTRMRFLPLTTYTSVGNVAASNNKQVLVVGSAFAQGAVGASSGSYNLPVAFTNACGIFRTEFKLTGTAAKTSAKYDETGPYKDRAKEASLDHMEELEMAMMFSQYSKTLDADNIPTYTTGGIEWYLQQWESAGGGYVGSSGGPVAAPTADTDDAKRIIENPSGRISERWYETLLERVFRVTSNKSNEKLVLCGSGFLSVINQMYKSKTCLNANLPLTDTYGMNVVQHVTPFGTVYYKTHPLWNRDDHGLRNSALILDVHNIKYKYVEGRDTDLLTNRQPNNADYRMDEWFTEAGIEVNFPESHMYIKNVLDFDA